MKMKFDFDGDEISVILVSLIARRNNILGLMKLDRMSESYYAGYRQELSVVDGILERLFPGSVSKLEAASAA